MFKTLAACSPRGFIYMGIRPEEVRPLAALLHARSDN